MSNLRQKQQSVRDYKLQKLREDVAKKSHTQQLNALHEHNRILQNAHQPRDPRFQKLLKERIEAFKEEEGRRTDEIKVGTKEQRAKEREGNDAYDEIKLMLEKIFDKLTTGGDRDHFIYEDVSKLKRIIHDKLYLLNYNQLNTILDEITQVNNYANELKEARFSKFEKDSIYITQLLENLTDIVNNFSKKFNYLHSFDEKAKFVKNEFKNWNLKHFHNRVGFDEELLAEEKEEEGNEEDDEDSSVGTDVTRIRVRTPRERRIVRMHEEGDSIVPITPAPLPPTPLGRDASIPSMPYDTFASPARAYSDAEARFINPYDGTVTRTDTIFEGPAPQSLETVPRMRALEDTQPRRGFARNMFDTIRSGFNTIIGRNNVYDRDYDEDGPEPEPEQVPPSPASLAQRGLHPPVPYMPAPPPAPAMDVEGEDENGQYTVLPSGRKKYTVPEPAPPAPAPSAPTLETMFDRLQPRRQEEEAPAAGEEEEAKPVRKPRTRAEKEAHPSPISALPAGWIHFNKKEAKKKIRPLNLPLVYQTGNYAGQPIDWDSPELKIAQVINAIHAYLRDKK